MKKISKVAIANRGEVACRIHRTCKEMGIKTVLLHSIPDQDTLAYRLCDETAALGGYTSAESYLDIDKVISAALKHKADAIHPGFGFLSENAEFAKKVKDAGLIFIGPHPETILSFGDKKTAKELCQKAGVPTIPGYKGKDSDIELLVSECDKIGYPVIVKATAGGGGRGMRVIHDKNKAREQISMAKSEALKAFGNDSVFLEKYLHQSKHIEVQIFGDHKGNVFVVGERECSVQRKHQKIIEETPSTSLNEEQRSLVHSYAQQIAALAQYKNAGTVEFLFQDGEFYFLEVNTRLQVEHPVTEEVYGVDLVKAQILTAQEQDLNWPTSFSPQGHSIELRLYAENPYQNGAPSIGKVGRLQFPTGEGRRFEYGIETGDKVTPYYDSMVAKIISTKSTRQETIDDLLKVLEKTKALGFYTNRPLLKQILLHPDFFNNTVTTAFFEQNFGASLIPELSVEEQKQIEEKIIKDFDIFIPVTAASSNTDLVPHPSTSSAQLPLTPSSISAPQSLSHSPWSNRWRDSVLYATDEQGSDNNSSQISFDAIEYARVDDKVWWSYGIDTYQVSLRAKSARAGAAQSGKIYSPMPGALFKVLCQVGDKVKEGDTLVVLEAMKMEHSIKAAKEGVVKALHFKQGDNLQAEDLILEME